MLYAVAIFVVLGVLILGITQAICTSRVKDWVAATAFFSMVLYFVVTGTWCIGSLVSFSNSGVEEPVPIVQVQYGKGQVVDLAIFDSNGETRAVNINEKFGVNPGKKATAIVERIPAGWYWGLYYEEAARVDRVEKWVPTDKEMAEAMNEFVDGIVEQVKTELEKK